MRKDEEAQGGAFLERLAPRLRDTAEFRLWLGTRFEGQNPMAVIKAVITAASRVDQCDRFSEDRRRDRRQIQRAMHDEHEAVVALVEEYLAETRG